MPGMPCLTQDTHTHAPPTSLPLGHTCAPDPSTRITAGAETAVHTGLSSAERQTNVPNASALPRPWHRDAE